MAQKINFKDHLVDDTLDLSLNDLEEVPVKEIASMPKVRNLDLTNNKLVTLKETFPLSLGHLVKLELSNNELRSLPENFGLLINLRHLDLYMNKLTTVPLSFGSLRSLRWLDLKGNPLVPKMANVAGPCLDTAQCQQAARNVVAFMSKMQQLVEQEIQRRQQQRIEQEELAEKEAKKKEAKKKKKKKKNKASEENNGVMENGNHNLEPTDAEGWGNDSDSSSKNSYHQRGIVSRFVSGLLKLIVLSALVTFMVIFMVSVLHDPTYQWIKVNAARLWHLTSARLPKGFNSRLESATSSMAKYTKLLVNNSITTFRWVVVRVYEGYVWCTTDEKMLLYAETMKHYWHITYIKMTELLATVLNSVSSLVN